VVVKNFDLMEVFPFKDLKGGPHAPRRFV